MPKPRLLLVASVLAIGLAAGFHFAFGAGREAPAAASTGKPALAVPGVITVSGALPPGHILRPDDLVRVSWANGQPPASAIIAGTADARALAGAVTRRAFAPGELIVMGSVIRQGERGFLAALVTPGNRAIAVSVEAATAAGGLIWPGDRVDIILTQEIREDGVPLAQQVVSETILSNVRILSTDQKLESAGDAAQSVEGKVEARRIPTTITVEVTPPDAERVTVAATLGRLHLTLRGVAAGEAPALPAAVTWAGSVSPALTSVRPRQPAGLSATPTPSSPAPAGPTPQRETGVRVYRGSQGA
ncbi:MAG: Flp pilus assembly protein CpaB [Sandaracinobacteroides sp.]